MTKKAREKKQPHNAAHTKPREKISRHHWAKQEDLAAIYLWNSASAQTISMVHEKSWAWTLWEKQKSPYIYIYVCVCINILFKYVSICIYVSILSTLHHDFERKYFQANRTFAWKLLHRFLLLWGARTSTFFFWNQSNMTYCFKSHRLRLNQQKLTRVKIRNSTGTHQQKLNVGSRWPQPQHGP